MSVYILSPSVSSCKDATAAYRPRGSPGMLSFPGLCSDAPVSVAAEGLLASSCGRSCNASASDSGIRGLPSLLAGRGRGGWPEFISKCFLPLFFCSLMLLWSAGALISSTWQLWGFGLIGEGTPLQYFGNGRGSFSPQCLPGHGGVGLGRSHERQRYCRCLLEETRRHSVKGVVRFGTGDHPLDESSFRNSVSEVHSREEKHFSGPAQSPRPGPSHGVVCSSQGVRRNLWGFRSPSYRPVCYSGKCQGASLCVSGSGSHGLEAGLLPASLGQSSLLHLSPVCLTLSSVSHQMFEAALFASDRPSVVSKGSGTSICWISWWQSRSSSPFCGTFSSSLLSVTFITVWRPSSLMRGGYLVSRLKGWLLGRSCGDRR